MLKNIKNLYEAACDAYQKGQYENAILLTEKATNLLKTVPKKKIDEDKDYYRYLAQSLELMACLYAKRDKQKALPSYKQAIKAIEQIPVKERLLDDWMAMVQYYEGMASLSVKTPNAIGYHLAASKVLSNVPKSLQNTSSYAAMAMRVLYNIALQNKDLQTFRRAFTFLQKIPESEQNSNYWLKYAKCHRWMAQFSEDIHERNNFIQAALTALTQRIPLEKRSSTYWSLLAKCQRMAGDICNNKNDWEELNAARRYYMEALESYSLASLHPSAYKEIVYLYDCLSLFSLHGSVEYCFYMYAKKMMSGTVLPNFDREFSTLCQAKNLNLLSPLVQLMRLIEKNVDAQHFPNESVKKCFLSKSKRQQLREKLKKAETVLMNHPSLLTITRDSTELMVGIVDQIACLHQELDNLKSIIQQQVSFLNEKYNHLKAETNLINQRLANKPLTGSIYKQGATMFESPNPPPADSEQVNKVTFSV